MLIGQKPLVILPKTTGMYRASVQFSDQYEDFKDLGAELSESVVIQ
jgi:hypothetical protein